MDKSQKEEQSLSVSIKRKHEANTPVSLKKKQEVASVVTLRKKEGDATVVLENKIAGETTSVAGSGTSKKQEKEISGRVLNEVSESQTSKAIDANAVRDTRLNPSGNSPVLDVKTGTAKKWWWGILALALIVVVLLLFRNCGGEKSDISFSLNEKQVEIDHVTAEEDKQISNEKNVDQAVPQLDKVPQTSSDAVDDSPAASAEAAGEETKLSSFAFGEAEGTATSELKALIERLKSDTALKVTVVGYTDKTGDPAYNQWLSEQRAASVKEILVNSGIDDNRIKVVGRGVSTRYPTNAENRRAVLIQE